MKHAHKHLLIASLVAAFGATAMAQTPPAPTGAPAPAAQQRTGGPMMGRMGHGDPARMQAFMAERHAQHMAELKTTLQLAPDQEGAWTAFAAAMQPPARPAIDRAQWRAEMEKLTTPERIDKMMALKAERDARMTQRASAAKTFYAALNASQKKVFDLVSLRHGRMGGSGGPFGEGRGMGPGMGHGMGMGPGMGPGMGWGPARP